MLLLLQKTQAEGVRASCEWAFLSVQLLALRCQVKGQPEDGSERKPFLFSWKQPSGPAQGSLLFCPRGFFSRRAFPGFFPLPLGTSCPASPCVLLWSLAKKAQHKQSLIKEQQSKALWSVRLHLRGQRQTVGFSGPILLGAVSVPQLPQCSLGFPLA